jgi:hypothetical protein
MTFIKKLYDANSQFDDIVQTIDNSVPSGGEGSIQLKSATGKLSSISTWLKRKSGLSDYALTGTSSFVETTNSEDLVLYETNEYQGSTAGGTWYTPESPQENDFFTVDLSSYTENNILIDIHPNDLGTFDLLDSSSESPASEESITLTQGNVYYFWLKENSWFYSDTAFPERLSLYSSEKLNIGSTDNPITDLFVSNKIRLDTLDVFASNIVLEKTFTSPEVTSGPIFGDTSYSDALISLNDVVTSALTSTGLDVNGLYTANASSNYLTAATSLQDADNKLDAQIKTNADAIAENVADIAALSGGQGLSGIQAEVDAIETGVGLSTGGDYVAPNGSNYIDTSTSVMDALDKLDQAVFDADQSHTDLTALEARVDTAEADIVQLETDVSGLQTTATNLQTEVDGIETGAGLNGNGSYTANAGSNYLATATSLKDADNKLDAQIKTNADAIDTKASSTAVTTLGDRVTVNESDIAQITLDLANKLEADNISGIQTEIDAIETAVGLNTDGSYSAHTTSNYIDSATSTKNALGLLDAQAKTNADAIAANVLDIATKASSSTVTTLQNELDTAEADIVDLQSEIEATQTGAGLDTGGTYSSNSSSNYLATATSLKDADNKLDAQIKTNSDAIALKAAIVTVSQISSRVDDVEADITTINTELASKLEAIDLSDIQSEIDATQTGAGLNTDGTYTANASASYISAATSLKDADNKLSVQVRINEVDITNLETAVSTLTAGSGATSTEIQTLQGEVDDTQTGAGLTTTGAYVANASANYISAATSLKDADDLLDTQVNSNATAIAANTTNISANATDIATNATDIATNATSISAKASQSDLDDLENIVSAGLTNSGLEATGGYTANSSANYISNATSLKDADNKLDAQIKTNADDILLRALDTDLDSAVTNISANTTAIAGNTTDIATNSTDIATNATDISTNASAISNLSTTKADVSSVANLSTLIDQHETSIGLNQNGTYITRTTSNYLNSASTLRGEITLLDSQVATNKTDIATNATAISTNATAIATKAATTEVSALQTEVDAIETGIGLNADGSYTPLTGNYNTGLTLKSAISGVDSQVAVNTTGIATNATAISTNSSAISTNASSISNLHSLADKHESSIGLNADGTYSAIANANYANSTVSLKAAVKQIDTQVKTNADDILGEISNRTSAIATVNTSISNLQSELNDTQTGAGLETNGVYTANSTANYIGSASSLKDADNKLDAQVKTNADSIATNATAISTNATAIATKAAATTVSTLQTEVDNTQANIGLSTAGVYTTPTGNNYLGQSTLKADLSSLDSQVKTNADSISTNANDINDLETLADTHETSIGLSSTGAYVSRSGSNYLDSATSIVAEATLLDAQVKTNANVIATKASSSSVSSLQTEVDNVEAAVGLDTDGTFISFSGQNYLNSASSLKVGMQLLDAAIKTRQDNIDTEAATRLSADNTLSVKIDTVESSVGLQTDGSLSITGTNYLNSSSTIVAALDTLDTNQKALVDVQSNIKTSAGLTTSGELSAYNSTNYIAGSLKAAVEALDAQVKTNADDISGLGGSDIANLQNELDATQSGVGLSSDGDYVSRSGTNYLDSSTNVVGEITALDTQVKTNADAIDTKASQTDFDGHTERLETLEHRCGGIFLDHATVDAVEMDGTLSRFRSHTGPFEINFATFISTGEADIIHYGNRAAVNSDKNFVAPGNGDVVFVGKANTTASILDGIS